MEPQNTNPNEPTPVVSGAPTVAPVAAAPVVNIPTSTTTPATSVPATVPAGGTATPQTPKKLNIPKFDINAIKKMPLKFKIAAGFLVLLVMLLILASFTKQGKHVKDLIMPSPSPIPASSPVGEVLNPTQYANDTEVLDIEKTLSAFDSKLAGTDLKEDSLRVPSLDYNVDFKKQ